MSKYLGFYLYDPARSLVSFLSFFPLSQKWVRMCAASSFGRNTDASTSRSCAIRPTLPEVAVLVERDRSTPLNAVLTQVAWGLSHRSPAGLTRLNISPHCDACAPENRAGSGVSSTPGCSARHLTSAIMYVPAAQARAGCRPHAASSSHSQISGERAPASAAGGSGPDQPGAVAASPGRSVACAAKSRPSSSCRA